MIDRLINWLIFAGFILLAVDLWFFRHIVIP